MGCRGGVKVDLFMREINKEFMRAIISSISQSVIACTLCVSGLFTNVRPLTSVSFEGFLL